MRAWIDIDNPPQVRCLLPFARHLEEAGHDVLLTARGYGDTFAILESEGAEFHGIGSSFGKGIPRKAYGACQRALKLLDFVRRYPERPDLVLTGSRSATLAARKLGIPSFVIIDYEYVNLLLYRLSGSQILYPSVIEPAVFRRRGINPTKLLPFNGLKEDISFAGVDLYAVEPHVFHGRDEGVCILFRPPAEESHYFRSESRDLARAVLRHLASEGARIVFSPRFDWQVRYLEEVANWEVDPIVLDKPIPSVALLKGIDAVFSAGGTMLREAAYLGVPAYSMFRSRIGAVDDYLSSLGRLTLITSTADFGSIRLRKKGPITPLRQGSRVIEDVLGMILERSTRAGQFAGSTGRP